MRRDHGHLDEKVRGGLDNYAGKSCADAQTSGEKICNDVVLSFIRPIFVEIPKSLARRTRAE